MAPPVPPPTDTQLEELFDRLWHDPRRRDDRSEFLECEQCGRAYRWIVNLRSERRSSLQIVARPVSTPALFSVQEHQGLVAVYTDRTGFTVGRFTTRDDVEDTLLYECHWDVCEHARAVRDRMHRERHGAGNRALREATADVELDELTVARYDLWRRGQQPAIIELGDEQP